MCNTKSYRCDWPPCGMRTAFPVARPDKLPGLMFCTELCADLYERAENADTLSR